MNQTGLSVKHRQRQGGEKALVIVSPLLHPSCCFPNFTSAVYMELQPNCFNDYPEDCTKSSFSPQCRRVFPQKLKCSVPTDGSRMSSSFPNDLVHLKRDGMGPEIVTPVSCLFPTIVGSRNILRQQTRSYVSSSRPRDRR